MKNDSVLRQITELETLSRPELQERWRELYGTEPPAYRRDVLVRRLSYRIQELKYGGLAETTKTKLRDLLATDGLDTESGKVHRLKRRKASDGAPVPGTRLVRIWHGERYEVTVVHGGFEYQGRRYRSLSAIAKAITGAHWNGLLFFGMRKRESKKPRT